MSEYEVPTEGGTEVGPPQFTFMSLVILTAAVAVFFALAQVKLIDAAGYVHLVLLFLSLIYRTRWKVILALNISLINCYLLPAILIEYFVTYYFPFSVVALWISSCLGSFLFAFNVADAESRFNKITGGIGLGINIVIFLIGLYLLTNGYLLP